MHPITVVLPAEASSPYRVPARAADDDDGKVIEGGGDPAGEVGVATKTRTRPKKPN